MFTGIIKELGHVTGFATSGNARRLTLESAVISEDADIGDSVAVNGVCLTLVSKKKLELSFDIMEETVRCSALAGLKIGEAVNLEGALRAGDSIGGHFVQGHVDCVGEIKQIRKDAAQCELEIGIPKGFSDLFVEKGSVALSGVSLTVGKVHDNSFGVYIIPHTRQITTLGTKHVGDEVNVEFDILGKYIARQKSTVHGPQSTVNEKFLKDKGFI